MTNKLLRIGFTIAILAAATPAAHAGPFSWFHRTAGEQSRPPVDANITSTALQAAGRPDIQQIASHIFCYCGCDVEHGHRSLLDCYTTGHVPVCKTCANEFVRISQMEAQHQTVAQMQNEIDNEFSHVYPYPRQSAILKQYISGKESTGHM